MSADDTTHHNDGYSESEPMTNDQVKPICISDLQATSLLFESKDRKYLWGKGETSDVVGPARVSHVIDEWGLDGGTWFIFYLDDCFFPPMYAVRGEHFQAAYEAFCDWHAKNLHGLKIEDDELKDYDEDSLSFTSNGIPIDAESVCGFEVKLVTIGCD